MARFNDNQDTQDALHRHHGAVRYLQQLAAEAKRGGPTWTATRRIQWLQDLELAAALCKLHHVQVNRTEFLTACGMTTKG